MAYRPCRWICSMFYDLPSLTCLTLFACSHNEITMDNPSRFVMLVLLLVDWRAVKRPSFHWFRQLPRQLIQFGRRYVCQSMIPNYEPRWNSMFRILNQTWLRLKTGSIHCITGGWYLESLDHEPWISRGKSRIDGDGNKRQVPGK